VITGITTKKQERKPERVSVMFLKIMPQTSC
jgi:hypothetical protein